MATKSNPSGHTLGVWRIVVSALLCGYFASEIVVVLLIMDGRGKVIVCALLALLLAASITLLCIAVRMARSTYRVVSERADRLQFYLDQL